MKQPKTIPFTASVFKQMQQRQQELLQLKIEVQQRLQVAREMGDLSENGAYKYAKFELGNIGRELRKLNHLLEHGYVEPIKVSYSSIAFGCTFTIENLGTGKQSTYQLVSEHEADPTKQKMSWKSPIGAAVVGKKIGSRVSVTTPRGEQQFQVKSLGVE